MIIYFAKMNTCRGSSKIRRIGCKKGGVKCQQDLQMN